MEPKHRNKQRRGAKPATNPEQVVEYLVWYLSKFGENSEANLRVKLKNKTDNQAWIDFAINKVIELGYQSDSRFADMIVRKGLGSKSWGKSRIEQEMRKKGLSTDVIQEALSALSDDDPLSRAKEAIDKKFRGREITEKKEWAKATRFLATRGFGFDSISSAIKLHNEDVKNE